MSVRRKPNELARQVMPLLLAGVALIGSNGNFTMIDDEARVVGAATNPVRTTLALFWSGAGQHEHPPLFDLLLHFWIRATGGAFEYLRIPSILFFLAGLFLLSRSAKRLGGPVSAVAIIWLGVLWPFGFHYARLAVWYSFSFFLISGLTLAYLEYLEDQSSRRWAALLLWGILLVWTNYFGWAILGCLAIDQLFRWRSGEKSIKPQIFAASAGVLCVAFLPLFLAFRAELHSGTNFHHRPVAIFANAAFSVYSLFVSEAAAPWYWFLSVPTALAILFCLVLVATWIPQNVRRILSYSALLVIVMAVTGILDTKRIILVAPWVLLPIAVATGVERKPQWRAALAVALLVVAGIGWYGVYSRRYYSAPRFIEPWQRVAAESAEKIQGGATVIANSPSFFLYLTYALRVPDQILPWKLVGLLPDQVRNPHVQSPEQWLAAGHPMADKIVWVRGMNGPQINSSMDAAAQELDHGCGARESRLSMRDAGYEWKQKFFPELGELQWRIEVRDYNCGPASSQEIFHIPTN